MRRMRLCRALALVIWLPVATTGAGPISAPPAPAHVSNQYRTSPLTKPLLADQLRAIFALHDQVRARVRIDEVRLVGEHAWIYSTGTVTGRLRWTGGSVPVLTWEHELEVARQEDGRSEERRVGKE